MKRVPKGGQADGGWVPLTVFLLEKTLSSQPFRDGAMIGWQI
jgi:hypothetical protein